MVPPNQMLGNLVSGGGKTISVMVALIPVYWTMTQLTTLQSRDGKALTPMAKELLFHPVGVFLVAYGTAYAAIGDGPAVTQSLVILSVLAYYIFVLHPEIGKKYFDVQE